MQKSIKYLVILIAIMVASCAKRGSITGGLKDTIAPVVIESFPKNYSKNFVGNVIKLNFDEYVKLKNVNKQLVVSPPMKRQLEILPVRQFASKTQLCQSKNSQSAYQIFWPISRLRFSDMPWRAWHYLVHAQSGRATILVPQPFRAVFGGRRGKKYGRGRTGRF